MSLRPGHGAQVVPWGRISTYYLFYFAILGAITPYWGPYLEDLGFSPARIGELMAVLMASRIIAPLLSGVLADRLANRLLVVRASSLLGALAFLGVFAGSSYGWLVLVTAAFGVAWAAALPPFEAMTLNHLGNRTHLYTRVRLWGSLGFIFAVMALGWLVDSGDLGLVPRGTLVCFLGAAVASMFIPRDPGTPRVEETDSKGGLAGILLQPRVLALFFAIFMSQASHGPYYSFYSIYLDKHGYSNQLIASLWSLGVVAEVSIFLIMSRILARFRPSRILVLALTLTSVRWFLIALMPESFPIMAGAQLLHAASYGMLHAVTMQYLHRFFTGSTQSTGQALYASLGYGAGGAVGSFLAGHLWESAGPSGVFMLAGLLPFLGSAAVLRYLGRDGAGAADQG